MSKPPTELPFLNPAHTALSKESLRERSPATTFLNNLGLSDAVVVSRWIEEVGAERFAELVVAFCEPEAGGRPKTNYSIFIDEFDRIQKDNPHLGKFAIANRVAKNAYARNDWQGFNPPATEKAFADTLKNQIDRREQDKKQRCTKGKTKDAQNSFIIRERVKKRAIGLSEVSKRFVSLDEQVKALKGLFDHMSTQDGQRGLQEGLRIFFAGKKSG